MLDQGAGRGAPWIELGHAFVGRIRIVDVVVGELLALHLPRGGDARPRFDRAIECGRLVRVLAVAQRLDQPAAECPIVRRRVLERCREPVGDGGVIGGGACVGLGGKLLPQRQRGRAAVAVELGNKRRVVLRLDHDHDIAVILGGGADHRRAADVDILDRGVVIGPLRDRVLERIEIDHQEIDRSDAVRLERRLMLAVVANRQQSAMHVGVQRLDAAVHHLRKAGEVGHVEHREARVAQRPGGAAGRDDLDATARQRAPKLDQSGLVRDGDQGTADAAQVVGHGKISLVVPANAGTHTP